MSSNLIHLKVAAISVAYLRLRVIAKENGQLKDPTGDDVEFGFTSIHVINPTPEEWYAGSWETEGLKYYARILAGPGTDVDFLEAGETYNVWIKIYDDPETPAHLAGLVYVY